MLKIDDQKSQVSLERNSTFGIINFILHGDNNYMNLNID